MGQCREREKKGKNKIPNKKEERKLLLRTLTTYTF
jgi:hypothetical protein